MPITIDSQNPNSNIAGTVSTLPSANRSGMLITAISVTSAMAITPSRIVVRNSSALAEMVTGTRISSANGLFNPPVRNRRKASCETSNSSVPIASSSDRRLFSGKMNVATRLAMIAAPTAR